jgi:hypothetical protein
MYVYIMDNHFFIKYSKYKNKYLKLKNKIGGHYIETSDLKESLFPFDYLNDTTFAIRNQIILDRPTDKAYNIDASFNFTKIDKSILIKDNITFEDLISFANTPISITNLKNKSNIFFSFDYSLLFLNHFFNIFKNFYDICINNFILVPKEKKFIKTIFDRLFIINKNNELIKLSGKTNLIFKFIFANKMKFFLDLIYSYCENEILDDELKAFLKLFSKNYTKFIYTNKEVSMHKHIRKGITETINDIANEICDLSEEENDILYENLINIEMQEFKEYANFVKILTKIPFTMDLNIDNNRNEYDSLFVKYSTSLIFFTMYYAEKLKNPLSSLGYPKNKLYPINLTLQLVSFGLSVKSPNPIYKQITKLMKSGLPKLYNYYQMSYKGNTFPDCVENTLLQFLKVICWDGSKYDENLLLNIRLDFKTFMRELNNKEDNSQEIKDEFAKLLSEKSELNDLGLYKTPTTAPICEIISNDTNFMLVLSYIFNSNNLPELDNGQDFKSLLTSNGNINSIKYLPDVEETIIEINPISNSKIKFFIRNGHSELRSIALTNIWKFTDPQEYYKYFTGFKYFDYFIILNSVKEYYPIDNDIISALYASNYKFLKVITNYPFYYPIFITRENVWQTFFINGLSWIDEYCIFNGLYYFDKLEDKSLIKKVLLESISIFTNNNYIIDNFKNVNIFYYFEEYLLKGNDDISDVILRMITLSLLPIEITTGDDLSKNLNHIKNINSTYYQIIFDFISKLTEKIKCRMTEILYELKSDYIEHTNIINFINILIKKLKR